MSWQEDLRRLDAELANGTITQHQHRKMRDELLAVASGGGAPAPVASPLTRADSKQAPQWQSTNPAQDPASQVPPLHPPQSEQPGWEQQPPAGQYWQADLTQPVSHPQHTLGQPGQPQATQQAAPTQQPAQPQPSGQTAQADLTQPVSHPPQPTQPQPSGQTEQTTPTPPSDQVGGSTRPGDQPAPADLTQPVSPSAQSDPGPEEPAASPFDTERPTQSVSAALLASSTPTSAPSPADERATDSMRFPSIEEAPTVVTNPVPPPTGIPPLHTGPTPAQHQPLPFDPAPRLHAPPKRRKPWLFVALGVVVVAALVVAGVWFLRGQDDTDPNAAAPPSRSAPKTPESVEARLPTLPGTPSPNNGTMTVDQAADLKLFSQEEGRLMKDNGAADVIFRGSSRGPQGYLVLVIPAGSREGATAITDGLYEHSLTAGLQALPSGSTDAKTVTGSNSVGQMRGTWYASGEYAVAIWVSQDLEGDPNALGERLDQTKDSLATALPPN